MYRVGAYPVPNLLSKAKLSKKLCFFGRTFGDLRRPSETFGDLRRPSETFGDLRRPSETFGGKRKNCVFSDSLSNTVAKENPQKCSMFLLLIN
jgi:hypothetical protein